MLWQYVATCFHAKKGDLGVSDSQILVHHDGCHSDESCREEEHSLTDTHLAAFVFIANQCILDGQRTGIVLSVSPLLPEEGSQTAGGSSVAPHGGSSVPMNLSSVMGVVGGATGSDVGRKFLYDGALSSEDSGGGLVVFVTHQVALVVSKILYPHRTEIFIGLEKMAQWLKISTRHHLLGGIAVCSSLACSRLLFLVSVDYVVLGMIEERDAILICNHELHEYKK